MQKQFLIDRSELRELIRSEVSAAFKASTPEAMTDRCDIAGASQITHFSTAHIYKLAREGQIPFLRYRSRLIFSRRDLLAWIESKTIAIHG
jgi:excisionase family DNA binding protein